MTEPLQTTVEVAVADTPNKNGRVYPRAELEKMIEQANKRAESGQLLGELGMGEGGNIEMSRVSHTISNLRWQGDTVVADITILKTPMGKIIEDLAKQGTNLDYRTRGFADVSEDGVISNFQLVSIDAVTDGA